MRRRRLRQLQLASGSPLFDREWYLTRYPDVARAGIDPLTHYLETGWREGRDPGPEFGSVAYLKANADVARSGMNPLIHYLEHGREDGRGTFDHCPMDDDLGDVSFGFEEPAPCVSFSVPIEPSSPWRRWHELEGDRGDAAAGKRIFGRAPDGAVRTRIEAHLEFLALLSGYSIGAGYEPDRTRIATEGLLDAWYVNEARLRTRWTDKTFPLVVRALQHDPAVDGTLALVGEGMVEGALDTFDIQLFNPLFPVLFVLADPNGEVRGCALLAFPSLCRGGLHYPELIARPSMNALKEGARLALQLQEILREKASPAAGRILLRLEDADGSGPMFRSDVRCWLRNVMRVAVEPVGHVQPNAVAQYLAQAVAVSASPVRDGAEGRILIDADSLVTVGALTEQRNQRDPEIVGNVSLLIGNGDPGGLVTRIDLPAVSAARRAGRAIGQRPRWPATQDTKVRAPLAIRVACSEDLRDAELFAPFTGQDFSTAGRRLPVTWILVLAEWDRRHVALSVQALAEQHGGEADQLTLVGKDHGRTAALAASAFGDRVRSCRDLTAALQAVDTPIVVRVSGGILLHDRRSADVFSAVLADGAVSTASLPLVSAATRTGVNASVVSLGAIGGEAADDFDGAVLQRIARCLWRTCYPVAKPSPLLFAARSSQMNAWLEGAQVASPLHLCSTTSSATQFDGKTRSSHPIPVPEADESLITKVSELFG